MSDTQKCDGYCNPMDGWDEECARHGRPLREVWQMVKDQGRWGTEQWERAERAEAKVARVEALHTPFDIYEPCDHEATGCDRDDCTEAVIDGMFFHGTEPVGKACDACRDEDGSFVDWPCPTRAALDAE